MRRASTFTETYVVRYPAGTLLVIRPERKR